MGVGLREPQQVLLGDSQPGFPRRALARCARSWAYLVLHGNGSSRDNNNLFSTDGRQERVMFDKITSRIQKLCYGLNADFVDPVSLSFVLLSCSLPL